jgi:hypothetical protein
LCDEDKKIIDTLKENIENEDKFSKVVEQFGIKVTQYQLGCSDMENVLNIVKSKDISNLKDKLTSLTRSEIMDIRSCIYEEINNKYKRANYQKIIELYENADKWAEVANVLNDLIIEKQKEANREELDNR